MITNVNLWSNVKADCKYIFLNGIVNKIPFWKIRLLCYRFMGMTIGKDSRILLGTRIMNPSGIVIGERTIVNEDCVLDGRGGLNIGNDVSVSIQSMILTGSHKTTSSDFQYITREVTIDDNAWLCARSTILPGSYIHKAAVIAAGCVFKGEADGYTIYGGVPSKIIGDRVGEFDYQLDWKPPMR